MTYGRRKAITKIMESLQTLLYAEHDSFGRVHEKLQDIIEMLAKATEAMEEIE